MQAEKVQRAAAPASEAPEPEPELVEPEPEPADDDAEFAAEKAARAAAVRAALGDETIRRFEEAFGKIDRDGDGSVYLDFQP